MDRVFLAIIKRFWTACKNKLVFLCSVVPFMFLLYLNIRSDKIKTKRINFMIHFSRNLPDCTDTICVIFGFFSSRRTNSMNALELRASFVYKDDHWVVLFHSRVLHICLAHAYVSNTTQFQLKCIFNRNFFEFEICNIFALSSSTGKCF